VDRATFSPAEREFLSAARVARLATADAQGRPHVVPIVFEVDEHRLYTPIDAKPKRVGASQLTRVQNLLVNPQLAIVVDEYDEDWSRLRWVMVRGRGELVENGDAHATGVRLLHAKYPQYQRMPLDGRPIIVITPIGVTSWQGTGN